MSDLEVGKLLAEVRDDVLVRLERAGAVHLPAIMRQQIQQPQTCAALHCRLHMQPCLSPA